MLSTFLLYPICWFIPGPDFGSYENPINTLTMLSNSATIQTLTLTFCALVFVLNSFSVLVTYMMSSVWHAILDNFRPITIWVTQLAIYYSFTDGQYGEAWTDGSWLELGGMLLLLVGTAIYNGSLRVPGFSGDQLLGESSLMASPALSRSPLITLNQAQAGGVSSPYARRPAYDAEGGGQRGEMLYVSAGGDKGAPLLGGSRSRGLSG